MQHGEIQLRARRFYLPSNMLLPISARCDTITCGAIHCVHWRPTYWGVRGLLGALVIASYAGCPPAQDATRLHAAQFTAFIGALLVAGNAGSLCIQVALRTLSEGIVAIAYLSWSETKNSTS
jgi:hypothetical protein